MPAGLLDTFKNLLRARVIIGCFLKFFRSCIIARWFAERVVVLVACLDVVDDVGFIRRIFIRTLGVQRSATHPRTPCFGVLCFIASAARLVPGRG